jgi:anti-sigma-K factor RskA
MTHADCDIYREFLAANALTALDAEDARALHTHLESCDDCRSEMSAWEETAALIALDAKSLEPTAQVRQRILASVRSEDRADRLAGERLDPISSVGYSTGKSQGEANVLTFERPPRNVWSSLGSLGAIAAVFIFVGLIISLVALWQQYRSSQRELARLSTEMTKTQVQLSHERAVVNLLTSPDAHMAKLAGTNVAPGAHAMLAYDKNGQAMLMASGLPTVPEGMAYQLWYIKDNKKMPGKVFTPDAAGNGILEDQIPALARDAAVFAVTLEPKSGVPAPTGSIYLLSAS